MALSIPVFTFNKDAFIEYINTMNKNSNVNKILEYNKNHKDKKKLYDKMRYQKLKIEQIL